MKRFISVFTKNFPYTITKKRAAIPKDISDVNFISIYNTCKKFTMTSVERMHALYESVLYLEQNAIEGDIVECGVWRGGSSMLVAETLKTLNNTSRSIYMYDTFEGMSTPGEKDIDITGKEVKHTWDKIKKEDKIFCYANLEDVEKNMASTHYPANKIFFIAGKVENTLPATLPGEIALLRLDTDWYDSTYHELKHLFPLVKEKGVVIIDDYGHWKGAREAVDQYFSENKITPYLHRIDYTGRLLLKI